MRLYEKLNIKDTLYDHIWFTSEKEGYSNFPLIKNICGTQL